MNKLLKSELNSQGHRRFMNDTHSAGFFLITGRTKGNIIADTIIIIEVFFRGFYRVVLETFITEKPYLHKFIIPKNKEVVKLVIGYCTHK